MDRILVATDGSAPADGALATGIELAAAQGAELIVAHVVPWLDVFRGSDSRCGILPHRPTDAERGLLDDAVEIAAGGGVFATTALLQGDAARRLVAFADSKDVDLVVVGARGRGGAEAASLGSVSRGVLRESTRPVLVVPAPPAHRVRAERAALGVGLGF